MKYYQLNGIIDEQLVTSFMEFCNNNLQDDCTIVINSGGGKSTLAAVVLDMINSNADKITLISAGAYSAALYVFFFAKCKKKIIYGSIGMYHSQYLKDVYINEKGNPKYEDDICQVENLKSTTNRFLSKFMTKKEKSLYNNHKDVYFTFKRMKKIFPDAEIVR